MSVLATFEQTPSLALETRASQMTILFGMASYSKPKDSRVVTFAAAYDFCRSGNASHDVRCYAPTLARPNKRYSTSLRVPCIHYVWRNRICVFSGGSCRQQIVITGAQSQLIRLEDDSRPLPETLYDVGFCILITSDGSLHSTRRGTGSDQLTGRHSAKGPFPRPRKDGARGA